MSLVKRVYDRTLPFQQYADELVKRFYPDNVPDWDDSEEINNLRAALEDAFLGGMAHARDLTRGIIK